MLLNTTNKLIKTNDFINDWQLLLVFSASLVIKRNICELTYLVLLEKIT